ncbi:MAG: hypothetical protein ACT4P3_16065 [Betaproteobacteria bacterium]
METCTVETGLLKKKPCGEASVTRCANCEQPLCAKHALPQLTAAGKKSGKFMCRDCSVAQREHEKAIKAAPPAEKPKAAPAAAPKAPAAAAKPAPAAAPAQAAPVQKPAAPAKAPPPPEEKSGPNYGGIDYTPSEKK